jgi:glutamate/tyrosine decarboxylase-like PLP-dependent enzyme
MPAVCDVLAFHRSAWRHFSAQIVQVPATSCRCSARALCPELLTFVARSSQQVRQQVQRNFAVAAALSKARRRHGALDAFGDPHLCVALVARLVHQTECDFLWTVDVRPSGERLNAVTILLSLTSAALDDDPRGRIRISSVRCLRDGCWCWGWG